MREHLEPALRQLGDEFLIAKIDDYRLDLRNEPESWAMTGRMLVRIYYDHYDIKGSHIVGMALVMSVISLYYYLRVLKAFLVSEEKSPHLDDGVEIRPGVRLSVFCLAALVVALGIWPSPFMELLQAGFLK